MHLMHPGLLIRSQGQHKYSEVIELRFTVHLKIGIKSINPGVNPVEITVV
jgi:hypothetical protein